MGKFHFRIFIMLMIAAMMMTTLCKAQTYSTPGIRIMYLGGDSAEAARNNYDTRTIHLMVLEKPGAADLFQGTFSLNLDSFPNLLTLELENIQTTVFTISGQQKSRLRELIVSASPTFDMKRGLDFLSKVCFLEHIKIEAMSEGSVPANLRRIRSLTELSIEDCDLVNMKDLLEGVQRNRGLEKLKVSGNFDVHFPLRFRMQHYIPHLDFSENYLSDFPVWMIDPAGQDYLDISGNEIYLSDFLYNVKKLKIDSVQFDIRQADDTILVRQMMPETYAQYVFDTMIYDGTGSVFTGVVPGNQGRVNTHFIMPYQSITPPIEGMSVWFYQFDGDAETPQVLQTGNGTSISIPAGAMMNEAGQTISGKYQLYFRDLTSPIAILLSGVPMIYDSGGSENIFESAGMFEIYAMQDSQMLKLKPGAAIDVELNSPKADPDFNLYFYDDQIGNWVPEGNQAIVVRQEERPKIYSDAYKRLKILNTYKFDTTSFETRYTLPQYARTRLLKSYFWGIKKDLYPNMRIRKIKTPRERRGQVLFKFPYVYSKSKRKYILSTSAYKELAVYCNYDWQYVGGLSKMDFVKAYSRGKKWTDVRIEYNDASRTFDIILKSPHEEISLQAALILPNAKDEGKAAATYAKLDKQYNKNLDRTRISYDRTIARKKAREVRQDWKALRKMMSPEEKKMTESEWIIYAMKAYELLPIIDSIYLNQSGFITRSLSVSGFGIYNCDKIRYYKPENKVWVEVTDENNLKISVKTAYQINQSSLAVISLNVDKEKVQFLLPDNEVVALCFIGSDGETYVAHYSEFTDPRTVALSKTIRCNKLKEKTQTALREAVGF